MTKQCRGWMPEPKSVSGIASLAWALYRWCQTTVCSICRNAPKLCYWILIWGKMLSKIEWHDIVSPSSTVRVHVHWILFACILAQAGSSQADEQKGIVLKGIHWGMSHSEMVTTLENRDYDCEKSERYSSYYCEKGEGHIRILDTLVRFNCDTLNTCEYESEEVAQMIINKGLVEHMDYEYDSGYCGRGDVGDKICAKGGAVYLHKDAFGKPEPSFD